MGNLYNLVWRKTNWDLNWVYFPRTLYVIYMQLFKEQVFNESFLFIQGEGWDFAEIFMVKDFIVQSTPNG